MRNTDKPLSEALRLIATMSAVTEPAQCEALRAAADVIDEALPHRPRIIIVGTPDTDPLVTWVDALCDDIDRVREEVSTMADRLEDVQRMVRKVFWHEHNEKGDETEEPTR